MAGSDFSQGALAGQEVNKSNPFNLILNKFSEAQARRYKEDSDRKKEEAELSKALQVLSYKDTYDKELVKVQEEEKRKTETLKQGGATSRQQELLKTFGMGGGKGGDIEITGGTITAEGEPTFTFGKTAAAKGKEASIKEGFERAEGIKRAAKKIASLTRQFNEALPQKQTDDFTLPFRIAGGAASLGAKFGLKANPQLSALQDTSKLQLRSILRDMGEGARMSDQDITQNLAVIEQAGLSDKERMAKVRSFMQTAVDGMDNDTIKLITEDDSSTKLLQDFGVKLKGNKQGGQLMTDAQGNKAMVYPDGTFEEVK